MARDLAATVGADLTSRTLGSAGAAVGVVRLEVHTLVGAVG